MKSKETRLYNILLPIWILLFWPSWLWLILIPANYIIDRLVLGWSLSGMEERGRFLRRHTWKICLAGFAADLAGAALLFALFMAGGNADGGILEDLAYGVGFDPFGSLPAFLAVAASVAASGIVIYLLDRLILGKAGLTAEQAKSAALRMALITAPYLYLFPSKILYDGMELF